MSFERVTRRSEVDPETNGHGGRWVIGTDTGGTFTDLVAVDDAGDVRITKTPSTPPNFHDGIVNALNGSGVAPARVGLLYHGTTVTTNALLTRSGSRTALVTSRGFRDVLEIRQGNREKLYDLMWDPPPPLVPRWDRLEVDERVDYQGRVQRPLRDDDIERIVRILRKRSIESVAIVFLHSYANPAHEQALKAALERELPDLFVSASYEILPQPPEFERTSTTVANAYVGPVMSRYVGRLKKVLTEGGYPEELLIMHSGGGTLTAEATTEIPIRTATSGPAAGVMAARAIGHAIDRQEIVSFDMGGTSADIATIQRGEPRFTVYQNVEWGMPVGFPSIDLVTIGAGGGSIAWIDEGGAPRSGPESAGANPGPACYGNGGTRPTNTDASMVLGRLGPASLLGGALQLDREQATRAVEAHIAGPLGVSAAEAAAGVLRIATENMANAIRKVTVQRGFDPREFSLLAFGGAGPMYAVELARELQIQEVVVPPMPGATSALGLLFVDARHDLMRPFLIATGSIEASDAERLFGEMEAEATALLERQDFDADHIGMHRLVDLRYHGQVRALTIPIAGSEFTASVLDAAVERFHELYEEEFRYSFRDMPVETRALRVSAIGTIDAKPTLRPRQDGRADAPPAGERDVLFAQDGELRSFETPIFERADLGPGWSADGPAVIEQFDSTTVLPPGSSAVVDDFGNVIVTTFQDQ